MKRQEVKDIIDDLTKEESESEYLQNLRERMKRCVCRYCGSELIFRRISYGNAEEGRVDIFCPSCNRIEYGVEPEIYKAAQYYVDEIGFDYYTDLDESIRKKRMNMAKVCEIMQWCCKNLGLLDENGFCADVNMDDILSGKELLLSEDYLKNMTE